MTSKLLFSHALLVFLLLLQVCAASMAKEEEKPEWGVLEEAFNNLTSMVEGSTSYRFTSEAYMYYYTIVYDSCVGNPVAASQFHDAYKTSFEDYITSKILPSLQRSRKEDLVGNLVKSWSNYKLVTRWFSKFMYYLNRYHIPENHLPSLELTSYLCFYDKVYGELHDQIKDAVLTMIRDERMGNQIDEKLLSDVQAMYHDMAERSDEHAHYSKELVESMSSDYLSFLTIKALIEWTTADPSDAHEYMLKLKLRDCLEGAEGENIVASFGQDINQSQEYFRKAPRAWFQRFASHVCKLGFKGSKADTSLFVFNDGSNQAHLLVYVDDIILTASSSSFLQRIIAALCREFAMTDLGVLHYFLGITVKHLGRGIHLNQERYALDLLQRAGMLHCNPVLTPVDTKPKLLLRLREAVRLLLELSFM